MSHELPAEPCPYFPDSGLLSGVDLIECGESPRQHYGELLALGYRRIGGFFYKADCATCAACIPIRLSPSEFAPSKAQLRTLRSNTDVRIEVRDPMLDEKRLDLYLSYLRSKHAGGPVGSAEHNEAVLASTHFGYPSTMEMDYYVGDRLVGVGIVDETEQALSANYFYYDTAMLMRRPGIFSILMEIALAQRMGKSHYYLGYYLEETRKMSYKAEFKPNELLMGGAWQPQISRPA